MLSEEQFVRFVTGRFPRVTTVAWDLDGTLGVLPGWDGRNPLDEYVKNPRWLAGVIQRLKARGVTSHLVSRNGMFCGDQFTGAAAKARRLGFHVIGRCFRSRAESKVAHLGDTSRVLLIDDQERECRRAVMEGASAICVKQPVPGCLKDALSIVMTPTPAARRTAPPQYYRRTHRAHRW